ncbi:energy transducer TonB [Wenzhouxiangella sp. XN79A]|uniref:energy transducer TonB n=1 Tax=Wenzhouxiangella sp. XN79A TaxID=2724193 RepID=UPI00144AD31A|nr:energy transducer TonB [Wenzhouxiangella sp. XN79A]NKI34846.1 energy transducer TonB [Wenzhouxiangella sp. XN79A]
MRVLSILLLCGLAALSARADEDALSPAERILLIQQAISGDLQAAAELDADGETSRWDLLLRGYALQAADRPNEAVAAWEESAQRGLRLAVRALAVHHYERRNWMESYAWARLAMEVDAALKDGDLGALRGGWALYTALRSAEALDEEKHDAADARASERVQQYLARLISPEDVGSQSGTATEDLEVVRRTPPDYPRAMAENGMPGWVYLQFEILPNGRVGEVAAVGASHQRFARAAVRAIRKWRFDTDAMETVPAIASQQIDFTMP